jgi:hypothetical protein
MDTSQPWATRSGNATLTIEGPPMMAQQQQPENREKINFITKVQVDRPMSATPGSGYKPPGGIG